MCTSGEEMCASQESFRSFKGMKISGNEEEEEDLDMNDETNEQGVVYNIFNLLATPAKAIRKIWR